MSSLCRDRGVPLLLVCPVSNLADCPPFKSQFSDDTHRGVASKNSEVAVRGSGTFRSRSCRTIENAKAAVELDGSTLELVCPSDNFSLITAHFKPRKSLSKRLVTKTSARFE